MEGTFLRRCRVLSAGYDRRGRRDATTRVASGKSLVAKPEGWLALLGSTVKARLRHEHRSTATQGRPTVYRGRDAYVGDVKAGRQEARRDGIVAR